MDYEAIKVKLIGACDSYYNKSISTMSDAEFDKLKDEFARRWPEDPFLKTIGAPIPESSDWKKVKHTIAMCSCNKVNTEPEFERWANDNGLADKELVSSEKLDGISLEILYKQGKLVQAITRGDGTIGEDITVNVVRMQNVKTVLPVPYTGSLRGEIMLRVQDFKAVNQICEARGKDPYQNARNGASGIAKGFDGKYTEYLYVEYYNATGDFKTKREVYDLIERQLGLKSCKHFFGNLETAMIVHNEYEQSTRATLDHEIDGLVIEPNNIATLNALGMKAENLRGQIAWKFTSMKKKTTAYSVAGQLGNSQRVTPVLTFETVDLCGARVSKASVHNYKMFQELNLHEGDMILVERANDVIPQVCANLSNHPGTKRGKQLEMPTLCPSCHEKLSVDGVFLVCKNSVCDGGYIGSLNKWLKKLDLKGIASATIEKLYEADLIKEPADLYSLKPNMICGLEGFGSSSANKIVETLNSKKELTFGEFIGGLNIPNFSDKTAELLEKSGYDSVKKILEADVTELSSVKGVGSLTAQAILTGLKKKKQVIADLFDVGITIKTKEKVMAKSKNGPFVGKKVVFTGALNIKRAEAQKMVMDAGGDCPSSLAKDTDYLVMADTDSTSTKAQKAEKYGTKVINEAEFMRMLK